MAAALALLFTLSLQLPHPRVPLTRIHPTAPLAVYARLGGRVPQPAEPAGPFGDLETFQRPRPSPRRSRRGPPTGRALVSRTDAGTLKIVVPPKGFGLDTVMAGGFAAAWFSVVIPATFAVAGPPMFFMLPFWAAGGLVAKQAVVNPTSSLELSIGRFGWSLEQKCAGLAITTKDGATDDLRGAGADVGYVNGVLYTALRLYEGSGAVLLGVSLSPEECESLAEEINSYLDEIDDQAEDDAR